MHRFYLPPSLCRGESLTLPDREARHALTVLRLRPHDRIIVLDGAGETVEAEIVEISRRNLRAEVIVRKSAARSPCLISLAQAIPKGKTMEAIIQKATELGVGRIIPLLSARVLRLLDEDGAASKEERWRQTAIEAMKQCGTPWLPLVCAPLTPTKFLSENDRPELAFIGSLRSDARHPRDYFDQFRARNLRPPASACLWVGPEGDFTDAEIEAARKGGAHPITLGPLVLRCETAAIAGLAILNYEIQASIYPASSEAGKAPKD